MTTTDSAAAIKPTGFECKFATYVEAQDGSENDLLVVKEYAHMPDGTTVPNLRLIHNYKRPFWVTREGNRNHEDKKEWEDINKLQKFESTQIGLSKNIARALGRAPSGRGDLRMLFRNQYLYGCDISTPTLAKRRYMDQWPGAISQNLVAALDSETDMIRGHEEIIMLSLTQRDRVKLVVVEEFFEGVPDPIGKIHAAFEKYLGDASSELGDLIRKRNLTLDVEMVKNAGECAHRIMQTAHEWQPDIISIWNINFDLPKMIKALEKYGFDLAATFSDPRVPDPFKYFKYKEGKAQKVTASGKSMALHPAEQWHTVFTPASFYFLDSMCVYLKLRIAKGKEASYSLDYILNKHLGVRKLKFEEANHLQGPNWHVFMQKNYKAEYCIYNIFDSISLEMLDEKITDLRQMISSMCEHSEFHRFPSQPRRTCDDLHFFALENGKVAATTSDKMEDELDQFVVPLTDWIVTLPSHMVFDDGLKVIEELPNVSTLLRAHVADLDVEGTYPNVEIIANISKETTSKELSQIRGVDLTVQRAIGIHLSGGHVNAVEICQNVYKAPSFDTMLESFRKKKGIAEIPPVMVEALQIEQQHAMAGPDPLGEGSLEVAMASEPEVLTTPVEIAGTVTIMVPENEDGTVPVSGETIDSINALADTLRYTNFGVAEPPMEPMVIPEDVAEFIDPEFEGVLNDVDQLVTAGSIDPELQQRIRRLAELASVGRSMAA